MANEPKEESNFYKGNTLLKAFGITSVLMLIGTIWMVMDDFGRQWKGFQREFLVVKRNVSEKMIKDANASLDQNKIKEIKDAIAAREKEMASHNGEEERHQDELVKLQTKEKNLTLKYQDAKLKWDVQKYKYESKWGHAISHEATEEMEEAAKKEAAAEAAPQPSPAADAAAQPSPAVQAENEKKTATEEITNKNTAKNPEISSPQEKAEYDAVMTSWGKVVVLKNNASAASQEVENKKQEIADFKATVVKLQKELKVARGDLDRLQAAVDGSSFTFQKLIRNSPIMDLASPTLRIQQIVLPTIRDDINFTSVQKVDRCTTCHQAIDTPGFEDQPNPFKTHPRLDLILGSRSPHPIDKIGCTVCHEGRGPAVEFSRSAHMPQNEEQGKLWAKKYGYYEVHHITERMLPLQFVEGKCRVCHKQTEYVPRAEKLNTAVQLIRAAGCYGCHHIGESWDHIRKLAPSLKRVKGKVTRDWMVKWVSNPRFFNDHARMPSSFFQSNVAGNAEYESYQRAEVNALVDFIRGQSEDYTPNVHLALGNAEHGKQLFGSIGCLGCHQINDFEYHRGRFGRAPDLSTIGSKVTKDWIQSWLRNPRHFWEDTQMPSLRLTDSEISDLSAFLMNHKNNDFDSAKPAETDFETQKKVLKLYLMRDPRMAPATSEKVDKAVAVLKPAEVSHNLGEFALNRYGCFGCHEIKGYETAPGIGTDLSDWASKLTNKLDFGLTPIEQSHVNWLNAKFTDTRIFDKGSVKEYLDLLRMPQFGFNEKERGSLTTAMLGFTAQKVSPPTAKGLNASETMIEEGQRVMHKYNCQGCHTVEQMFQPLPDSDPMHDEHEKAKHDLEGRILAYYPDDESLGPPPLITEGKRIWPSFGYNFVNDPSHSLRLKLKVRMPTFQMSNDELDKIVTYWANYGGVDLPVAEQKPIVMTNEEMHAGEALFKKLQCINCHTVGTPPSPALLADPASTKGLAPDLARAYGRLRHDWIVELLKDPQKMIPGTRMPGFWPDMNSPAPEILGGNSQKQIDVLASYILSLGEHHAKVSSREQIRKAIITSHLKGQPKNTHNSSE